MRVSIQTNNLNTLREVVNSNCDEIRFGSEFCEWKIPNLPVLTKALNIVKEHNKQFTYITPKISSTNLEKIKTQLDFLKEYKCRIVINDLGILNIVTQENRLFPHLGRQLVYIAARCPWISFDSGRWIEKKRLEKIYYQTSLNFEPMIDFLNDVKIKSADVDWIPQSFQHYQDLGKRGINLSIYLHLIPITLTRKCHIARFFQETNPENCSKPCNEKSLFLKQKIMQMEFFLWDNAVFRYLEPSREEIKRVRSKVNEFIIMVNPITKMENQVEINNFISNLQL
jgi:hypothetical protein